MFAKLFTTEYGQFLITKDSDEDGHPTITARYAVQSPMEGADAVITKTGRYDATDEGEERRDAEFEAFDQVRADSMANEGL